MRWFRVALVMGIAALSPWSARSAIADNSDFDLLANPATDLKDLADKLEGIARRLRSGVYVTAVSKGACTTGVACEFILQQDLTYASLAASHETTPFAVAERMPLRLSVSMRIFTPPEQSARPNARSGSRSASALRV